MFMINKEKGKKPHDFIPNFVINGYENNISANYWLCYDFN